MTEPSCQVRIHWDHFRRNLDTLMQKGHTLMPVIKADAYGHGVREAAGVLEESGTGWAAAGTMKEAATIRRSGFSGHIVALLSRIPTDEDVHLALALRLSPLIHNWEGLHAVKAAVQSLQGHLDIAVKVDTGMHRLGFPLSDMEKVAEFLAETPELTPLVQVSHFAVADDPVKSEYTKRQCDIFYSAAEIMHRRFPDMRCSLGNTAGLAENITHKDDICRPGLALYGCDPLFGTSHAGICGPLLPVMEVTAPLISVHPLHRGEGISYGLTYTADSERLVGWVAIGYADGYRRNPAPGTCMCINGRRVPVIGRVAMQMTCVDLTDLPTLPKPGDTVHILGGPGDAVTAQELADWWGTIPYEVTCLMGKNRTE